MRIQIINGPNLNLLGTREPEIYGTSTLSDCIDSLMKSFPDIEFFHFQSNSEGALIDSLHRAKEMGCDGVVLNAAAYTHTSVALRDAIAAIGIPVIEVHISNPHAREDFRRHSLISPVCRGVICGFGLDSYHLAVQWFVNRAVAGEG